MPTTAEHIENSIEAQQESLARHTDPAYSLGKSKEEWFAAVAKLEAFVKKDDIDPYDFTLQLEDLVNDINIALHGVQNDAQRVTAGENPGWGLDDGIRRYSRLGGLRHRLRRNQFDEDDA